MSAPNDWKDHTDLYNWAYKSFGCIHVAKGEKKYGDIPVISGVKDYVPVHPAEDFNFVYNRSDQTELSWDISKFVYAPVVKNREAGTIRISNNVEIVKEIPLVFGETVGLDPSVPLNFFERFKGDSSSKFVTCIYFK